MVSKWVVKKYVQCRSLLEFLQRTTKTGHYIGLAWCSNNKGLCTSLFGPGLQNLFLLLMPGPQVFWHFPHILHAVQVPSTFGLGEVVVLLPKGRTIGRTVGRTVEVEPTPVPTLPPPPAPVFSPVLPLDPPESVPGVALLSTVGSTLPDTPPNSFSDVEIYSLIYLLFSK